MINIKIKRIGTSKKWLRSAMCAITVIYSLATSQLYVWSKNVEATEKTVHPICAEQTDSENWQPDPKIILPVELQVHTYELCQGNNLPYEIVMSILWHESGYLVDVPDNVNLNGTTDRGLAQINSINWEWLADHYGLDVNDPYDNISACIVILSRYWHKYGPETALAIYASGEHGALNLGRGKWFAETILERS